jgi:hypothetical protein
MAWDRSAEYITTDEKSPKPSWTVTSSPHLCARMVGAELAGDSIYVFTEIRSVQQMHAELAIVRAKLDLAPEKKASLYRKGPAAEN